MEKQREACGRGLGWRGKRQAPGMTRIVYQGTGNTLGQPNKLCDMISSHISEGSKEKGRCGCLELGDVDGCFGKAEKVMEQKRRKGSS